MVAPALVPTTIAGVACKHSRMAFGGLFSFGGLPEASAAVVFGLWFLTCLVPA
jgi:hypothetical protein